MDLPSVSPVLPRALQDRLGRLAPDQRAAAVAAPGPVLCVAPAGSGKTTTLVARVAWLIGGPVRADPATVCAVTFNRRAAEELRARLEGALGPLGVEGSAVRVRTFHALGREILADAGVDVSRLVAREELLVEMLPKALPSTRRRFDDAFSRLKLDARLDPRVVAAVASQWTRHHGRRSPPDRPRPRRPTVPAWLDGRTAAAFLAYESHLRDRGILDFDDLVVRALDGLVADDGLRSRWRERCSHLLVDEVQDVDRSQLDLALLLAGPARRIFLVGDDDQTIYAWRLADVRRVIGLAARLPGLRRVDLAVNYRCPRPVVERAVRLVAHNRERFRKRIRARAGAAGHLHLAPLPTDDATRARRLLARWLEEGLPRSAGSGTRWAVLARTNAELAPFAAVALEMGIPFSAEEHGLLLETPRVDELVAAAEEAAEPEAPPLTALARLPRERAPSAEAGRSRDLVGALLTWAAPYPTLSTLRDAIAEAGRRLVAFRREDAALVLATVHGTKGLEFDHVAVVGLDEGRFPNRRSVEESEDPTRAMEEERRLAYVAWTRAKVSLTLLYDPGAPSPFLREAFSEAELQPA